MAFINRRLCVAALSVTSVLTVGACGSSGNGGRSAAVQADNGEAAKPGPQVLKDAAAALTAAGAARITGTGTQGKPPAKFTVEGHIQSDGLSISEKSAGGDEDFVAIGKTVYLKGLGGSQSAFPAQLAKQVGNRWVTFTGDSSSDAGSGSTFFSAGDDASLASFATSLSNPEDGVTINPKVTRGTLDGQPVVLVTESDGSTFTVAAHGTPYLLKAFKATSKKVEDGSGTLVFSDFGKRVVIKAPADAVDLESLLKKNLGSLLPSLAPGGFPTAAPS